MDNEDKYIEIDINNLRKSEYVNQTPLSSSHPAPIQAGSAKNNKYIIGSEIIKTRQRINYPGANFHDLPVNYSQIVPTILNQKVQFFHQPIAILPASRSRSKSQEKLQKFKQQFELLRAINIDNQIIKKVHRNYEQLNSKVNRDVGKNQVKTGHAVRDRKRRDRHNKISSSQMFQKKQGRINRYIYPQDQICHRDLDQSQELIQNQSNQRDIKEKEERNQGKKRSEKPRSVGQKIREKSKSSNNLKIEEKNFMHRKVAERHGQEILLKKYLEQIQALLQKEFQLQKKNHELEKAFIQQKQKLKFAENPEFPKLLETVSELQKEIDRYKIEGKRMADKIGFLEGEIASRQAELMLIKDDKNKLANQGIQLKLAVGNLQIENQKLVMQKNIEIRALQYQMESLIQKGGKDKAEIKICSTRQRELQFKIRALQQLLSEKDMKNKQLLNAEHKKNIEVERQFAQKIQNLKQRKEHQALRELQRLKNQSTKFRQQQQLSESQFGLESKVVALEKVLKRDEGQHTKIKEDWIRYQKQHEQLKSKYQERGAEKQELYEKLDRQIRITNKVKLELAQAEDFKYLSERLQVENANLNQKIDRLENQISRHKEKIVQIEEKRESRRIKQEEMIKSMKQLKIKVEQTEFENYKIIEESKISLDLCKRKLELEKQVLANELQSTEKDRDYYKELASKIKGDCQSLAIKVKDYEFKEKQSVNKDRKIKIEQANSIKKGYEDQIRKLTQIFISKQKDLINKLNILAKANETLNIRLKGFMRLEAQNLQLRQYCKSKMIKAPQIMCLWDLKQIQYENINQVLKEIKNRDQGIIATSDIRPILLNAPQQSSALRQFQKECKNQ